MRTDLVLPPELSSYTINCDEDGIMELDCGAGVGAHLIQVNRMTLGEIIFVAVNHHNVYHADLAGSGKAG